MILKLFTGRIRRNFFFNICDAELLFTKIILTVQFCLVSNENNSKNMTKIEHELLSEKHKYSNIIAKHFRNIV